MIKKLITLTVENRSLNHVLFLFLLLLAYASYTKVAKEMFPPSSLDVISIQGHYEGANSTILEKLIVRDIESIVQNNQYITNIDTLISNGTFHINCEIKDSKYIQESIDNIKNNIENLRRDLPADMDLPIVKAVENYFMLLNVSVSSDTNTNYIETAKILQDEIKRLPDLHSVELDGEYDPLMVVSLNEQKLLAYQISKESVYKALSGLYSLYPIGSISSEMQKYYIESTNSDIGLRDLLDSEILVENKLLSLGDIADVRYDYENKEIVTRTDAKESVIINVKKAKSGDAIKLSRTIKKILSEYKERYPEISFKILNDSSFWIQSRLNTIASNIIIGLILLFLSIWLFISLKIALTVILGIPVSFAFGFIGLDFFDASLNTLSMTGVLLSLGILVDEAIVVSENIHRHLEMKKDVTQACIDATYEMMPILFASMLTTIIAFLPLTMLSGSLGIFIKIIPLIVIVLVLSSFVESFVFLPLHYKELSLTLKEKKDGIREKIWQKTVSLYRSSLYPLMHKRYLSLFSFITMTFLLLFLFLKSISFVLFPEFDAMTVNITAKAKNGSIAYTLKEAQKFETLLLEKLDPKNVASLSMIAGMKSDGRSLHERGNNLFTITLHLKQKRHDDFFNKVVNPLFAPYKECDAQRTRELYAKEIKEKVEFLIRESDLAANLLELDIDIPQTGVVKNDIEIALSHHNNKKIEDGIEVLQNEMRSIKEVSQIKNDMNMDELKAQIKLNSYGKNLGFTQEAVISRVRAFVSLQKLSKIVDTKANLIELKVNFFNQDSLESLYNLSLKVPSKPSNVSLKDIVSISFVKDTTTIRKENFNKIFTLSAHLDKKRLSSRKFYKLLEPTLERLRAQGIGIYIKGEQKTNEGIKRDVTLSLLFIFFVILIVLIWLFGSLRLSLLALSVIPFSLVGVFAGHAIMDMSISFSSVLGFVGLIGIIVNDTLIMLKVIKESDDIDGIIRSASLRVRPILLTSVTTVIGLSTLIFFASGESLLMQPLAVSMGFGLIYATIINLYYLPLAYSFGIFKKE